MNHSKYILPVLLSMLLVQCGSQDKKDLASDGRSMKFEDTTWASCQESNEIASFRIEYESGMDQVTEKSDDDSDNVFKQYCHDVNGAIWCETGSPADNILSSLSDDIRHKLSTCCYKANGSFFKTTPINKFYNVVEVDDAQPPAAPAEATEGTPAETDTTPAVLATAPENKPQEAAAEEKEEPGFWARWFGSDDDEDTNDEEEDDASDTENSDASSADTDVDDSDTKQDEEGFFSGWFGEDGKKMAGVVKDASDDETDKAVTLYHKSFDPNSFGTCHQK